MSDSKKLINQLKVIARAKEANYDTMVLQDFIEWKAADRIAELEEALTRFRKHNETMIKRIEFSQWPIGNCNYCLVGNKPGPHHLPDCPAHRSK